MLQGQRLWGSKWIAPPLCYVRQDFTDTLDRAYSDMGHEYR